MGLGSVLLAVWVSSTAQTLPGPGLDLPVDLDSNGVSTYGDKYAFNLWLKLGGDVNKALAQAQIVGDTLNLHAFFTSAECALSPDAPVAQVARIPQSAAGVTATCPTTIDATPLLGVFSGGTIACIQEDATTLKNVSGMTMGDRVYVTREDSTSGGVTKIDVSVAPQSPYTLPLDPSQVVVIPSINLNSPPQLAWDSGSNSLLITERPTNKIWRYVVPNGPLTLLSQGEVSIPYGVAVLPAGHCIFGEQGDLFVSENLVGGIFKKYGFPTTLTNCPGGTKVVYSTGVSSALGRGVGIGQFSSSSTFAVYYVSRSYRTIKKITAVNPSSFSISNLATFNDLPTGYYPSNVVIDPLAPVGEMKDQSMYVSVENPNFPGLGSLWIVQSNQSKTKIIDNLKQPAGIVFTPTGVMLISEKVVNRVLVVDGFRCTFIRGDVRPDFIINDFDAEDLAAYLWSGAPPIPCLDAGDFDDNGYLDGTTDVVNLGDYVFDPEHNACPKPPYPNCGFDPTPDLLGCIDGNCRLNISFGPDCGRDPCTVFCCQSNCSPCGPCSR